MLRPRAFVAALAVVAVLAYGGVGHTVGALSGHDGMAGSDVGLCLLLVAVGLAVRQSPPAVATNKR